MCLLQSGQEHELGATHQFRASLLFTAFALEAYLNHLGPHLFKSWETFERKLTPSDKLTLLCEHLKLDLNWSARPWQTIKDLMRYRNTVAHGRGEKLVEEYKDTVEHYQIRFHEVPLAKWESYGSEEMALRARADVEDIVNRLHKQGGDPQDYPFFFGSGAAATASP